MFEFETELQTVRTGYDRETCWVQTRAGLLPPNDVVITTQKLRLTGSDIFYAIHSMHSEDSGRTWTEPVEQESFAPRPCEDGSYFYVSDFWPKWHEATGTLLGTGHTPLYRDDELMHGAFRRQPAYAVYDAQARSWRSWQPVDLPEDVFFSSGSGCVQRVDLPDGDILLPVYHRSEAASDDPWHACCNVVVLRCSFDGVALRCTDWGNSLTVAEPRGLCEPSLAMFGGRFYLTLRNDVRGYVAASDDGLHFSEPVPWRFDDGEELGNYNTQQHWLTFPDALCLVYTRRGAENDHVFRHRAPLFMAEVDPERMCVIRETEQVVLPERGARLGNFGTVDVSDDEGWVVVSEWMQTNPPNPHDCTVCEKYGSDNAIFIARVRRCGANPSKKEV
ncbi:MAG: exo-alpha-sialidase [Lentisphaeria bacterium]|nr:exo-alpha-sialidase [Lentisphaeria bacterium]